MDTAKQTTALHCMFLLAIEHSAFLPSLLGGRNVSHVFFDEEEYAWSLRKRIGSTGSEGIRRLLVLSNLVRLSLRDNKVNEETRHFFLPPRDAALRAPKMAPNVLIGIMNEADSE